MTKRSDSFFRQGASHDKCEDYAVDGTFYPDPMNMDEEVPYAIVSDGCSSATDTDFGSRFITKAFESTLDKIVHLSVDSAAQYALAAAEVYARSVGVTPDCLHATAMIAYKQENTFIAHSFGDGVIVAQRNDGSFLVDVIDYENNAPLYLYYSSTENKYQAYKENCGGNMLVTTYTANEDFTEFSIINEQGYAPPNAFTPYSVVLPADDYQFISVITDGITSFTEPENTGTSKQNIHVTMDRVLPYLVCFKNRNGEFVKRRCKSFFDRDLKKNKLEWQHQDDLSIGVVR